jgi:hypothetical protein
MGIDIITRGMPKAPPRYRITCPECESVLEFGEADLEPLPGAPPNGYFTMCCPVCSEGKGGAAEGRLILHANYLSTRRVPSIQRGPING